MYVSLLNKIILNKSLLINISFILLHTHYIKNCKFFVMYAIVDIAGQQFKVEKDSKLYIHRLQAEEGTEVEFDKVLLIDNNGKVKVGKPTVKGAKVSGKVLSHLKGDKVKVFKKKRRKGYKVTNGHRQLFTQIQIEEIVS